MYHLIYASSASKPFSQLELDDLLIKARQNNIRLGITGMLIYRDGNFIQGGFKNQPQQLMFSSGFSKFHIKQEFVVNRYGGSKTE